MGRLSIWLSALISANPEEKLFNTQRYEKYFEGRLALAGQGHPLAECQIAYFYYDGLGVEKYLEKALCWTRRAADHGDRPSRRNADPIPWAQLRFASEGQSTQRMPDMVLIKC